MTQPSSPLAASIDLAQFRLEMQSAHTTRADYPGCSAVEKNIPIYDGTQVTPALALEWAGLLADGPGVMVIQNACQDTAALDEASAVFRRIIAREREAQQTQADHFAAGGANDRIWNSLQKLCLEAPQVYVRYMANPAIDMACRAWLGPGYQMTCQVNQVRPGGKAQAPHRDYHLGFMAPERMLDYPPHVHTLSPVLTLQGAIAHCDAPIASGTTKFLPFSQRYVPGYMAALRDDFRDYFEHHCVQLPLAKGDAVFFNPALFHAAGDNQTADVERMVNLTQASSAFGRSMESVDRHAMSLAIYPYLAALPVAQRMAVIAATAEGYAFPTNLDRDPPLYGLAPPTQQDVLTQAVQEQWSVDRVVQELAAQHAKHLP